MVIEARAYQRARRLSPWLTMPLSVAAEYAYVCPVCPRRFRNAGGLTRHETIHRPSPVKTQRALT